METRSLVLRGAPAAEGRREDGSLEQRAAMERFLASVERRAYGMARLAVGDPDDALDIVQDAMLRLVRRYATADEAEWPPLFFRIVQNRIRDHQRRGRVRRRVLAFFGPGEDGRDDDPLASVPAPRSAGPDDGSARSEAMTALEAAIALLPDRQREAFLLRALEGLDVAASAQVMGCSAGSVKTHYSRAVHSLRAKLGDHWP